MEDPMIHLLKDIIRQQKHDKKMLVIALVISIFLNCAVSITFIYFQSQWDYQTTTTTTTEQQVDGDNGTILNGGDQYNDNAQNRSTE